MSKEVVYGTKMSGSGYYLTCYALKASASNANGAWYADFYSWRDASYADYTYEIIASDMTYDPVGKKIYGWFAADADKQSWRLAEYDGDAVKVTPIGSISTVAITALAADQSGMLWGIEGANGKLYQINKVTGVLTEKGSLAFTAQGENQSAAIDPASGSMYWSAASALYKVDMKALTVTKVYDYNDNENYTALFIPAPDTKEGAPAAVENLKGTYTGNENDVVVSFTAPSLTFGGSPLSGSLDYVLQMDGEDIDNGTVDAGGEFSKTYSLADGAHGITVQVSNTAGKSPIVGASVFVGYDMPGSVSNLLAVAEGNHVVVTWDVPQGINGGLVDASKLAYTVTRNGKVSEEIASGLTATTCEDDIPQAPVAEYSYTVTVVYDNEPGESLTSSPIMVGDPYTVPYLQDFEGVSSVSEVAFKSIAEDAWTVAQSGEENSYISSATRGSCLFTAPVYLYAGVEYTLKFKIASNRTYVKVPYNIFLSKSQSDNESDFVTPYIKESFSYAPTSYNEVNVFVPQEMTFTAPESGIYAIGFKDMGTSTQTNTISLDDIEITGIVPVPKPVENLTATTETPGSRDVKVSFTTPTQDVNGEALASLDKIEVYRDGELVQTITEGVETGKTMDWTDYSAPRGLLSYAVKAYADGFVSEAATASVTSGYAKNLTIKSVDAPSAMVAINGTAVLKATIANDGSETAEDYKVTLVCDGTDVEEAANIVALAPDAEKEYSFTIAWAENAERAIYKVRVDYEGDEFADDNLSEDYEVLFEQVSNGVDAFGADGIAVRTAGCFLEVAGAAGKYITVFDFSGKLVAESYGHGDFYSVRLDNGIYVVNVNGYSCKIIMQ